MQRNKHEAARKALATLRNLDPDSSEITLAMNDISQELSKKGSFGNVRLVECFQGTNLRRTILGMAMAFFTIATGITFWFGYGTTFFIAAGVQNSYLVSLMLAVTNCVFTLPSIYLIEKVGRRRCLIWGGVVMALTQLISAVTHSVSPNSVVSQKMLVVGSVLFIAAYAPTWGIGGEFIGKFTHLIHTLSG